MTRDQARACFMSGYLVEAEIIKNPGNLSQWFVLLRNSSGKAYMLDDDTGKTLVDNRVETLLAVMHDIGFRQVLVHL